MYDCQENALAGSTSTEMHRHTRLVLVGAAPGSAIAAIDCTATNLAAAEHSQPEQAGQVGRAFCNPSASLGDVSGSNRADDDALVVK